jgi:ferric enterobactin receptor
MKPRIKSIYLLLLAFALLFNKTAIAQATHSISGTIIDSVTKKPLDLITVNLKTDQDVTIKTTLTAHNGVFTFDGLKPAKYKLVMVAIGYQPKNTVIFLDDKNLSLDPILLIPKVNTLKEVTVTADRPVIKQLADRIIYDLLADPESKSNNVLTMMRKVPFISLDASNNLLLKGNSSFKVFINGKPSGMLENNLKAVLQNMPASTIQSIEVVTNPPAKYDAEGLAGIINIITNKKTGDGFKGTLSANQSFPNGGPGLGTSFSAKQGRLGITGYGGAGLGNSPATQFTTNRITFDPDATNLVQKGTDRSKSRNGYFGTGISYEIDSLNLISGRFNISGNHADGHRYQNSILNNSTGILQAYDLDNSNNSNGHGFDAGVDYQLGFKADKNRLLTFSYQYSNYHNKQFSNIGITNPFKYNTPDYEQDNNTGNKEQTFQVDYVHPVKNLYIEGGLKAILRNNESNFQYNIFNAETGQFEPYPAFSDRFNYTQNVFGAYNSYRYAVNSWSFSAGLRLEKTVINADFISSANSIDQHSFNLIPVVSINKNFKDKSSLSFGFNQRIKRPSIRRLNPFVDRSNPDFESTGNPNLKPTLVNNLQLTYNNAKKLSVTVALGYSFINNIDLRVTTFDTLTRITHTTYQNTGKASRLGLDYNLSYPFTNQWNMSINGNLEYFRISGLVNNILVSNNLLGAYVSASTGYRFNKGWRANAGLNFRSSNPTDLQGRSNAFVSSSFSVNKELIKNKLTFAAAFNNPFTKYRNNRTKSFGPGFEQLNNTREYFRSFSLNLNYNFGTLTNKVKKNQRGINNDDLSK